MADLGGFDANTVEESSDFSPLPAGDYRACVIESRWVETKAGDGRYLELVWQVVDGTHANRMLWERLNLENPNERAVAIARRQLGDICKAVGVLTPKDSSELHNKPVIVSVAVREQFNDIKKHKPAANGQVEPERQKPAWMA